MSKIKASDHPYRNFRIPIDTPFELKPATGKGWGAFATRPIPQGTMIMREKPLFIIPKHHKYITEIDLCVAYQRLPPRDKRCILNIRDNASKPFATMESLFAENSFVVKNPMGHGLYPLHSRINHSCIPNCKIPEITSWTAADRDANIESFATRDIAYGEEITFCYQMDFECRTRESRHRELRFVCECKACTVGTPFQKLSDMRRVLIRGLEYLCQGVDIDGHKDTSSTPLISNPTLRKAAECGEIPLSDILVYSLLCMALLEQEGLMTEFLVGRVGPGLMRLPYLFNEKANAEVAKLAMAKETWVGKLCVAFKLFGRVDAADGAFAVLLRMERALPP